MKTLTLTLALILTACGSNSTPPIVAAGSATQTTSPTAAGTIATQTFAFAQAAQICTALKSWNPNQTSIQFPGDPAGYVVYLFTAGAITQNGQALSAYLLNIGTGGTPLCTLTISGGKMVSCQ